MTYELDERLSHGLSDHAVGGYDVRDAEERKEYADADDLERLEHHVLATKTRKTLVPDGSEQLLHVWMRHELEGQKVLLIFLTE